MMEHLNNLGGAAPGQFKEKRIGGVTGGIRVGSQGVEATTHLYQSKCGIRVDPGLEKLDKAGSQVVEAAERSEGEMVKPDRVGLLMTGESDADKVMEKSWMNSLGFVDLVVHGKTI